MLKAPLSPTRLIRDCLVPAKLISVAAWVICIVLCTGNWAKAQQLEDRPATEALLPETTVMLAKVHDFGEFFEKMKTSLGAQMLDDERFAPLANQLYEVAQDQYLRVEESVGLTLDELQSLPSGELSVALVAPRRKDMALVVMMELDEENEAVDKALGRVKELIEENGDSIEEEKTKFEDLELEKALIGGETIYSCRHQGVLIASNSKPVLEDILLRWSGEQNKKVRPLTQNRKFITISNRCSASEELPPDLKLYVDPIGVFKAATRGDVGMQVAVALLPAFGLDGLLAVGGHMYMQLDGYETILHGQVMLASPREGVFDAIALKPGDYQPQDWVPVDISSYLTTRWDFQQMYASIEEISNKVSQGTFDQFIQNAKEGADIDLKEDIIDRLTGRVSVIRPMLSGDQFNAVGNIFALELKDPEDAEEFLERLLTLGENEICQRATHGDVEYWTMGDLQKRRDERRKAWREKNGRPEDEERFARQDERRESMRKTMRFPTPSCVILDDNLIFGDSEEFIKIAIDTFDSQENTLFEDANFQRNGNLMTKLLKTEVPAAFFYFDTARELALLIRAFGSDEIMKQLAQRAEENPEFLQGINEALNENDLPDYELLRRYIPASGGFVTSDDTGYHFLFFQESRLVED